MDYRNWALSLECTAPATLKATLSSCEQTVYSEKGGKIFNADNELGRSTVGVESLMSDCSFRTHGRPEFPVKFSV